MASAVEAKELKNDNPLCVGPLEPKNAKTTKKLASYGLLPSVRKMGFTSHFIYLTLSHKTYVLTLFNIIFYFLFIYPLNMTPLTP